MKRVATVLYEDKQQVAQKQFPPHEFVLAMVRDVMGIEIHELQRTVVGNPKNGVSKLLGDVRKTSLIAGAQTLFVLVDRDRVAEHLQLPKHAPDIEVVDAIKKRSDSPNQLSIHFLVPNLEGLMGAIAECGGQAAPKEKGHIARDLHLKNAAFVQPPQVRECVRGKQKSLATLVDALVNFVRAA